MKRILTFLFWWSAFLDVLAVLMTYIELRYITKPLILIFLLLLYNSSISKERQSATYTVALLCCWLGDVVLLFSGELFFIVGLGAFLIAHGFYIKMLYLERKNQIFVLKHLFLALPYALSIFVLFYAVSDNLEQLFVPVLVYAVVIGVLGFVASVLNRQYKSRTAFVLLVGVWFFILSDFTLALDLFYKPSLTKKVTVMVTYVVAQYLIYKSRLSSLEKSS